MEKEQFFTKQPKSKGGGRRVPRVGDRIVFSDWRLEALEIDGRHVGKVRASHEPGAEA
jgi:CBS domain containing-hemolysin-like protein